MLISSTNPANDAHYYLQNNDFCTFSQGTKTVLISTTNPAKIEAATGDSFVSKVFRYVCRSLENNYCR